MDMDEFLKYINSQDIEQLKSELKELYSGFEWVRDYYQIKFSETDPDEKLLSKYKDQIINAMYPDEYMEGGLDLEKVDYIVKRLNSVSTIKYYIEICLYAIEHCTHTADAYGGDFGDDFYTYFEELFEQVLQIIIKERLENAYKIRLEEIANTATEGYGHQDQLRDVLSQYY